MKHFLMFYSFVDDYLQRREQYRDLHLQHAWDAQRQGALLLGGALTEPTDGGVLLFQADSPETVSEFARKDPYVVHGLVTSFRVREWLTVVGTQARKPIRPEDLAKQQNSR